jgi:hypothetical protein
MAIGYVYILINASMPDLLKIGHSTGPPAERAKQLSIGTGVPTCFVVAYEEHVGSCEEAEREVHTHLDKFRVNSRREFFAVPLKEAIRVVANVARNYPVPSLVAEDCGPRPNQSGGAVQTELAGLGLIVAGFLSVAGPIAALQDTTSSLLTRVIFAVVFTLWSVIVLGGGIVMILRRFYPLALAASIVAMLPVNPLCCIGLPIGIWSLTVLYREEVRDSFVCRETPEDKSVPVLEDATPGEKLEFRKNMAESSSAESLFRWPFPE